MNSDRSAGISPYNGKSVHYPFFTYRQLFVDMVELSTYASPGPYPEDEALPVQPVRLLSRQDAKVLK
jgi:hypothetical protein